MRNLVTSAAMVAGLLVTTGAFAQDAQAQGQANVGMSLPGAAPANARAGTSDHDQMVGRLAVGYFGVTQVGAGVGGTAFDDAPYTIVGNAPVIGVRYWLSGLLGLDIGLGLGILGGSVTTGDPEVEFDRDSFTGFNLHGGVPLALASADHFTFEIVPELNVGIGSASTDPNGDADGDISYSGFHFDIGARAGAEIHFGFIKIPQLALQGSVGVALAIDSGKTTDSTPMGADVEAKSSTTSFGTTVQGEPWDIFTGNIAALYYF
jgi:hypothetical protein